MGDRNAKIVMLLDIIAVAGIVLCLWYKLLLPYVYLVISFGLALLPMSLLIRDKHNQRYQILQIFLIYLLIRNVYYVATGYSCFPFGDAYRDYGVSRVFSESGEVHIIQLKDPVWTDEGRRITYCSGWPLLHIMTLTLSSVTNLNLFDSTFFISSTLGMLSFIFVYMFIEKIRLALKLTRTVTILALIMYSAFPNGIFWSMQFVRMNPGILFFTILAYLILAYVSKPNVKNYILIMIFSVSLVLSHHFSSFVQVLYLFLLATWISLGNYLTIRTNVGRRLSLQPLRPVWNIAILMLIVMVLWWNSFSSVIWPLVGHFVERFIQIVMIGKQEMVWNVTSYPNSLTPGWTILLSTLRLAIIFLAVPFGFLILFRRKTRDLQKPFIIYSIFAFGIILAISFTSIVFEWDRIILLAMPFLCLCSGIFYERISKTKRKISKMVVPTVITLLVVSSFVNLWGIAYVPIHLYDPAINQVNVGEHNVNSMNIKDFISKSVAYDEVNKILADDFFFLYVILPTNEYRKIQGIDISELNSSQATIVIELNELNLYAYYFATGGVDPQTAESIRLRLENVLQLQFNKIYDNGGPKIWKSKV